MSLFLFRRRLLVRASVTVFCVVSVGGKNGSPRGGWESSPCWTLSKGVRCIDCSQQGSSSISFQRIVRYSANDLAFPMNSFNCNSGNFLCYESAADCMASSQQLRPSQSPAEGKRDSLWEGNQIDRQRENVQRDGDLLSAAFASWGRIGFGKKLFLSPANCHEKQSRSESSVGCFDVSGHRCSLVSGGSEKPVSWGVGATSAFARTLKSTRRKNNGEGGREASAKSETRTGTLQPPPDLEPSIRYCFHGNFTLEMMHLQEAAWSFKSYLRDIAEGMPHVLERMAKVFRVVSVGLASFVDKPFEPFGQPDVDYCFKKHVELGPLELTKDNISDELSLLSYHSGRDALEFQLASLHHSAKTTPWSTDPTFVDSKTQMPLKRHLRLLSLATDYLWHEAGDAGFLPPHPGDGRLLCTTNDYISRSQLREALKGTGASVLFLLSDPYNISSYYRVLSHTIPTPSAVTIVRTDWSDLQDAYLEGLGLICKAALLADANIV